MALFKRKNQTTIAELEEYYASQRKNRGAKAWAMALLSLLITFAVIVGLFFGGKWVFETLFSNDATTEQPVTTTDEPTDVALPSFDGDLPVTDTPADQPESEGVVSDEAAVTTTPNNPATASAQSLPNTGSGELLVVVLITTSVIGTYTHRLRTISKN